MVIALVQTNIPDDFEIPELTKRAQNSSRSLKTKHYKAVSCGREVAFVSLDRWPELNQMVVYEIFVPISIRRQGIATAVLNEVERISAYEGFSLIRLRPSPLDIGVTMSSLIDWYNKRGYVSDLSVPGDLVKSISNNEKPNIE